MENPLPLFAVELQSQIVNTNDITEKYTIDPIISLIKVVAKSS
jgi:hypothetical protein